MLHQKFLLTIGLTLFSLLAFAQTNGKVEGRVLDKNTQELIQGAQISISTLTAKYTSDFDGKFSFELPTGTYNISVKAPSFFELTKYNIVVTSGNAQVLTFELSPQESSIDEVIITDDKSKKATATDMVTPLSVQRLTSEEIKSNPGGNYDVSKVVQALPGVGGSIGGGRNDIIIRGGAPNENVYYLDGIEIPVLNHFQTQGSSGGAQGIVNVSFIEELKLSSSAFDARYDNALASTFVIKQRQGNSNRFMGNVRASFT
uniref:carboxypeptidase regulatory-like domain-containing protein n=1 Tax=Fluviicola sp. TaxID=1917219 RepID=UPI004049BE74